MKLIKKMTILFIVLFSCVSVWAEIRLPAIINDNAVLQRQTEVCLWGWAKPDSKITIQAQWLPDAVTAKSGVDGKWAAKLTTREAGGPYTLSIADSDGAKVLNNIMLGEVWLCSGQSNMGHPVKDINNADEEIAMANFPNIRLFKVALKHAVQPLDDCQGTWSPCSPEAVSSFSAAGYFFGRKLHISLHIPIGLIDSSWGGTPAETWTSEKTLRADSDLKKIIENQDKALEDYKTSYQKWETVAKEAQAKGQQPPAKPGDYAYHNLYSRLYNSMIYPLVPYTLRGAIWYQGESNALRAWQYRKLFSAMITNWRQDWDQGDFSFYFVQLANYHKHLYGKYMPIWPNPAETIDMTWPELREAQLITLQLPNTGMAVTMDIGNPYDIHPRNKQDVGRRLALWALAKDYGFKDLVYSGPLYKSMQIEANKIRLSFEHVGGGLVAHGYELKGFTIAGQDQKFVEASAQIDGETVLVWSDKVAEPKSVRYGWTIWSECNLFNREKMPASPFRTDDWPATTFGRN